MTETIGETGTDARDGAMALALQALVWTLSDGARAQRLLDLSGLTPDQLRSGAGDPHILAETLRFLEGYEPDLVAAAEAVNTKPETLIKARRHLQA